MRNHLHYLCAVSLIAIAPGTAVAQAGGHGKNDIVVTAAPLGQTADETVTPVVTLTGEELIHRRAATLGETLAGQPGINFENFGGGASRPIIRGQSSPRVQVLSDSANVQDASAISPDHNITGEPLLLRGIEVLRGPATLLYGSGAIGGAVNLLDEKVPTYVPEGGIAGAAEGRLGTGDDERSLVGGATVGVGPLALRVEGVHRRSDDYRVPRAFGEDRVHGSYNDTSTFSVGGSWIGPDGYLGVAYTRQRNEYGVPGHNHDYESCHPHGIGLHCGSHGEEEEHDHDHDHEHDHEEEVPFVKLRSNRFDIRSDYDNPVPALEKVRFRLSFTDYAHDEIEDGEAENTFLNKAHDLRVELTHAPLGGLRGTFGIQQSGSRFQAISGGETHTLNTDSSNTAIFLMETYSLGPVRLEAAARQEWQTVKSLITRYPSIRHKPFSASAAAIWNVGSDYSLALSLAHTERAPSVQELYAYGLHLATNTYEIGIVSGNSRLAEKVSQGVEKANSVNLTLRKTAGPTTFTIGAYHQDFDNYIYAQTLDQFEDFRLIRYAGAEATFTGIDGEVRHAFNDQFALSVFGDYVRAKLKNGGGDLPRIPAGRLGARGDAHVGPFTADAEYYHVFEQDRIAAFETRTPGYDMVNATLAYRLELGDKRSAELFVRGTNLTNELAYNHSSFIKTFSPLRGRNFVFGLRGAF
ncbi:TonB-dependent receptor [Sphingobium xenophagum]|uniref:TonB-dependent receptor n=1 Tax=Sphingobium xenophagum TaxID=121428 RepID=A0A249MXF0_SPHXE|nr:TonB-dependent receptor [Sphingobium xenophagum]ASY45885.1 TonB-dependent receptor [Sphingobium xenophagum]